MTLKILVTTPFLKTSSVLHCVDTFLPYLGYTDIIKGGKQKRYWQLINYYIGIWDDIFVIISKLFIISKDDLLKTVEKYGKSIYAEYKETLKVKKSTVDDCKIIELPKIHDHRGNISFIEGGKHIPFDIRRVYYLYDVPGGAKRGGHAHKELHQLIISITGSFDIVINDGISKKRIKLSHSHYGLYLPPMIWRELNKFTSGSICLVIVSEKYDKKDYIRNYDEFLNAKISNAEET